MAKSRNRAADFEIGDFGWARALFRSRPCNPRSRFRMPMLRPCLAGRSFTKGTTRTRMRCALRAEWPAVLPCLCFVALIGLADAAWAADVAVAKSGSEAILLAQILLLILLGRGLGEAMLRIGQPAVMGSRSPASLWGPPVSGL